MQHTSRRQRSRYLPRLALAVLAMVLAYTECFAQAQDEQGAPEHTIILGVGGATELELANGSLHAGGNVMVEWDAIENWLEFEVGASLLAADRGVEAPVDLLVKKPFQLTRWAEVMIGIGPEVVLVSNPATKSTYFGGVAALDFMFWPWGRHVGLWVEPEYDLVFRDGLSHGLGSSAGLLLGW